MERRKQSDGSRPTKRQLGVITRLRRLLPRVTQTMANLRMLQEKQKALLKVKALQQRKRKLTARRKKDNEAVKCYGPKGLVRKRRRKEPITEYQAESLAEFWRGIWGVEGHRDKENPVVADWRRKMGQQIARAKSQRRRMQRGRGRGCTPSPGSPHGQHRDVTASLATVPGG